MRLILTTDHSAAESLKRAGLADIVLSFGFRFVWGPLPSAAELATLLAPRSAKHVTIGDHWLDFEPSRDPKTIAVKDLGLIEVCERCETIELWIDPVPNAQLILIWLLDYLRHHENIASKLTLVQTDAATGNHYPEEVATWRLPAVKILNVHLEQASAAWRACRASPQDWFNLLSKDLAILPRLRPAVVKLLEELPMRATGLGATEMRMLQLLSEGIVNPIGLFPHHRHQRKVFEYDEAGSLLDGLAHCPAPAVTGLGDGPFAEETHNGRLRQERYVKSRISLTPLGKSILTWKEDFSRHNPISRWWGGTRLTNDNLWRWDPRYRTVIAP
ncbi:MAG TPA: hypothetical protein VIJ35_12235 [Bradyrhizobium sp.]